MGNEYRNNGYNNRYGNDRGNRFDKGGSSNRTNGSDKPTAESFLETELKFMPQFITAQADKNVVEFAYKAGKFMSDNKLSNSKIRSIYGEIKRIQMGSFEKEKPSFYLLKPKVAYSVARDDKNEGLKLFQKIFDKCYDLVVDQHTFLNFCNLFEAILAYHKFFGEKP